MRHWLPAFAVRRPVTVGMTFLALMVLGAIAFARIPLQMMPQGFDYPFLWVWVPHDGASPVETERQVIRPLEERIATVAGIKQMRTRSSEDYGWLSLEFHQSADLDTAYNDVIDAMERTMPELPPEVRNYGVYRYDPDDEPIVWVGMTIPEYLEDQQDLVEQIVGGQMERVPGVGKVEVWGGLQRAVFVDFDRERLFSHGIDLGQLIGELSSDNFQLSSGKLEDRGSVRFVRSLARFEDLDQIKRYPVRDTLVLEDIADISYRADEDLDINRLDGLSGMGMAIYKESSANTVQVSQGVQETLGELGKDPRLYQVGFHTFFDQGEIIQDSIDTLLESALWGGLFAVIVLFVFLKNVRLTLLIASAMPLSILLSITMLWVTGSTLNLLSLMGLMIAVGMVVDNAVVVVETIYRRRRMGVGKAVAAIEGTGEVNLAITLSTMTTMVVFLPLILMSGDEMFSFFMGALGFPVVFALAASLFVALILTPLATLWVPGGQEDAPVRWLEWLEKKYQRALGWMLSRRFDSFLGLVAVVFLTVVVPFESVSCTDSVEGNLDDFVIRFEVPPEYRMSERRELIEEVEAMVDERREKWGVRVHRSQLSYGSDWGRIYVYLDPDAVEIEREKVLDEARRNLPDMPGVNFYIGWGRGGDPREGNTMELELWGDDSETLALLAEDVLERLRTTDGVLSATTEIDEEGSEELRLHVDRDASARYGVSSQSIGRTLAFAMRGSRLADYREGEHDVEVWARFGLEDRQDLDTLLDFEMWGQQINAPVPLRALVQPEVSRGYDSIYRKNRKTNLDITVNLEEGLDLEQSGAVIDQALGDMQLPRGYSFSQGRRFDEQAANEAAQAKALLLSITFVFLLMGVLFESFLLPMSIITTIPMALLGVYWTLWATGTPLDTMGGVGLVVLVGVVVNNGIVLVDLVTQLRREGHTRTEALVEAGGRRMRPILMTALTTLFGLLPMAMGSSSFIGIPYAPLGRVVGGGLAAATLLTLFFVPFMYTLLDDLRSTSARVLAYATRSSGRRQRAVET